MPAGDATISSSMGSAHVFTDHRERQCLEMKLFFWRNFIFWTSTFPNVSDQPPFPSAANLGWFYIGARTKHAAAIRQERPQPRRANHLQFVGGKMLRLRKSESFASPVSRGKRLLSFYVIANGHHIL